MKVPRKKKKQIPKNIPYCYTPIKFDMKTGGYHIKTCPFYKSDGDGLFGRCSLLDCEVMDQIKECEISNGY